MNQLRTLLNIGLLLIKAFPKFFAGAFSFIPYIGIWIQFLPEMIELTKKIKALIELGVEEAEIRRSLKHIDRAFLNTNRQQAARELNDVFRN